VNRTSDRSADLVLSATFGLTVIALVAFFGVPALMDPDEGRNAAVALSMADTGDLLLPRFNGLPYLDKPFFFFAAVAASFEVLGVNEWAARLPSILSTLASALLTAWFARRLFGARAFSIAGLSFLTIPLTYAFARIVIFDAMLSLFLQLALIAFFLAMQARKLVGAGGGQGWSCVAWVAVALGIMIKGPVALALPLLVVLPYGFKRGGLKAVFHWSFGLAVVLVAAWLWAVEVRQPGFLHYAIMVETVGRFFTDDLRRSGAWWYFLPLLMGGAAPWALMSLTTIGGKLKRRLRLDDEILFLALWLLVPLVFFTISNSKRPQYILPLMPAVALLVAAGWLEKERRTSYARVGALVGLVLGALLVVAALVTDPSELGGSFADPRSTLNVGLLLGVVSLGSGLVAWVTSARPALPLVALAAPMILLPVIITPAFTELSLERSERQMAAVLSETMADTDSLVGIETYSPSLAFYLQRDIVIVSATGEPLRSNYVEHAYASLVSEDSAYLRPIDWWQPALLSGGEGLPFVVLKLGYDSERRLLEAAGYRQLSESSEYVALAPPAPASEARAGVDPAAVED
jgi:4-amino-4-deoxy-L-arabinose transferase-like glycosyltransferase